MTETALETVGPKPPDDLPPGWGVTGWVVEVEHRWMPDGRSYRVELSLGHVGGAEAYLRFAFVEPPRDYDWLHRYLIVVQDVPGGIRADTERRAYW